FSLLCVAAMYTQYGAVFLVLTLAIQVLLNAFSRKDWNGLKRMLGAYAVAGVGTGIPLVYFFLLPQSSHPVSTFHYERVAELEKNLLYDFFHNLLITFRWLLIDAARDTDKLTWFIWGIILVFLLLGIWGAKNNRILRYLMGAAVISYILYYGCTVFKIYGYGWFGTRHVLFYLPILFVTFIYSVYNFAYNMYNGCAFHMENNDQTSQNTVFSGFLKGVLLITAVLYCCYGGYRLHNHWWKSDERSVVSYWYDNGCVGENLFVDHKQRITFLYYLQQNEAFDETCLNHVYSNPLAESEYYSTEEWRAYFETYVYPRGMPQSHYILTGTYNGLMEAMQQMGYRIESVVDTTTNLFYCYK
ncbi:MAG: hypothetical protein IJC59_03925, partial [Lachnospiraceae bacterium]|nr:hypothetical protein [Lachnospiraceae bacterium]